MKKTNKKLAYTKAWNISGINAPEEHKNLLIKSVIESYENTGFLDPRILDGWMSIETNNVLNKISQIIGEIKNIDKNIFIYVQFQNYMINKMIITSPEYQNLLFDKITDIVMDYESDTGRRLDFYYTDQANLIRIPENSLKI